jgi:hypothetical protein
MDFVEDIISPYMLPHNENVATLALRRIYTQQKQRKSYMLLLKLSTQKALIPLSFVINIPPHSFQMIFPSKKQQPSDSEINTMYISAIMERRDEQLVL